MKELVFKEENEMSSLEKKLQWAKIILGLSFGLVIVGLLTKIAFFSC